MHFTRTTLLALLTLASAATGLQAATTITAWTDESALGMNGITEYWLPTYNNQVNVTADITVDTLWTNGSTYVLTKPIFVKNGAKLTIEPGTVIRGFPWTDPDGDKPGTLVVTSNGKINARGTAAKPIIFTDMWDNNVPGMTAGGVDLNGGSTATGWHPIDVPQQPALNANGALDERDYSVWQPSFGFWGGVVIIGRTPIAHRATNEGKIEALTSPADDLYVEGLAETPDTQYGHGPLNDDDNSGVFAYASIRYGGYPLSGTKEINGLTMYGVGRSTEIHHVEAFNCIDDAFEWFGGTVNTKYLVAWAYGDDGFDCDEGYRGKAQFLLAVQGAVHQIVYKNDNGYNKVVGSAWADKGMELDGSGQNDKSLPMGLSQWYNITIIGKGTTNNLIYRDELIETSINSDQSTANTAILARDNFGGQIYNSLFLDFRGAGIAIETRKDKVISGYLFDCETRATTDWNVWPANSSVFPFRNADIYLTQTDGKQLEIRDNLFMVSGPLHARSLDEMNAAGGRENARALSSETGVGSRHVDHQNNACTLVNFTDAAHRNKNVTDLPIRGIARNMDTNSVLFARNIYAVTNLNPCAVGEALHSPRTPPADGFYAQVNYKGAFGPDSDWTKGWTAADATGLLSYGQGAAGSAAPQINAMAIRPSVGFATVAGARYDVESAPTAGGPWTGIDTIIGSGDQTWVADPTVDATKFYRLIKE
jgi:hypothetical protein